MPYTYRVSVFRKRENVWKRVVFIAFFGNFKGLVLVKRFSGELKRPDLFEVAGTALVADLKGNTN